MNLVASVYITTPDDLETFARQLEYVLKHPMEANAVGQQSSETAVLDFDSSVHGRRLMNFSASRG